MCAQIDFSTWPKPRRKTPVSASTKTSRNKSRMQGNHIVESTVQTDRTILNNKPDVIICDNEKATCMLIDVVISGERNVIKKAADENVKYKDFKIKTQRVWNVKTNVILEPSQNNSENT
jgi:hypothetical protein